jgi:hypothetical protein
VLGDEFCGLEELVGSWGEGEGDFGIKHVWDYTSKFAESGGRVLRVVQTGRPSTGKIMPRQIENHF